MKKIFKVIVGCVIVILTLNLWNNLEKRVK